MKHEAVEKNSLLMAIFIIIVMSVGGLVEIVPLFFLKGTIPPLEGGKPYTALQLEGRDIYLREGCYNCHSQMLRPLRAATERYGLSSGAGEFVYDRPFQWGSKRTGPDLHRVGGRYSDEWHRVHLINPRDVLPESIMPGYPWRAKNQLDGSRIQKKMRVLRTLGHPYTDDDIQNAPAALEGKTEMDALIAYLQGLRTTITARRARGRGWGGTPSSPPLSPEGEKGASRARSARLLLLAERSTMADFTSSFWSWFIIVPVVGGIVAMYLLHRWMTGGPSPKAGEKPKPMGHVWDEDLQELNNPLPKWWLNLFYITLVFGVGYLALYPGLGNYAGAFGWTQKGQDASEDANADKTFGPLYEKYLQEDLKLLAANHEALKTGGGRVFKYFPHLPHPAD